MLSVSVGICAYNEEANIGNLLNSILNQELHKIRIKEIFVVSSECTDETNNIVLKFTKVDNRIKLIKQTKREGKSSAINLFLKNATGDICVLESADTIPYHNTFENLCIPFLDNRSIGMTGAHPVPINKSDHFVGFLVNLLWRLHHKAALVRPKCGELVAFRNVIKVIPLESAVDEASIEAIILREGYTLYYADKAHILNKGPDNLNEYLIQRRRIICGHKWLEIQHGYKVSTSNLFNTMKNVLKEFNYNFKHNIWIILSIWVEIYARALGYYDYFFKRRNPYIWEVAKSTKKIEIGN